MAQHIPYNTGKVLIGSMYEIPSHEVTPLGDSPHDEDLIWTCICSVAIILIVLIMNVYTP